MGSFDIVATGGSVVIGAARASTRSFSGMITEVGEGRRNESFNAASLGEACDGGVLIFNGEIVEFLEQRVLEKEQNEAWKARKRKTELKEQKQSYSTNPECSRLGTTTHA
ncbi:hypothetical protein PIB30_080505 [Stylosanthes scabra]|uniref:Uncharacterized protein n=1 Tax=Stylosanthes scabra TaxID=79078 RepID=A0ABU6RSL7_9FABA|nr:hypothetical protein [Stylosanthes scabra]